MTSQISVEITNMETPDDISPPDPSEGDADNNNSQRPSLAWRCLEKAGNVVLFIVLAIAAIVALPFLLMYLAGGWFFCGIVNEVNNDGSEKGDGGTQKNKGNNKGYVQKLRDEVQKTTIRLRFAKLPALIRSRLVILCLAWFIVNLSVSGLRRKDFLGTHLWKWTFLLTLILCGYHFFSYATRFAVHLLLKNGNFKKNSSKAEYYIKGLRRSMSLVLYSGSVLLTWVSYFRTSHGIRKNGDTKDMLHIGTWTFVSLTVTAILWLLKNILLLIWEADAVYNRFRHRILSTGSMFYFLCHIYGSQVPIFQPKHNTDGVNDHDQASDVEDDRKKDDQAVDHRPNAQDDQKKDEQAGDHQPNAQDDQKKDEHAVGHRPNAQDDQKKDEQVVDHRPNAQDDQKKDEQAVDHQSHTQDDQKKDDHQESRSLAASTDVADKQTGKQEKQDIKEKAKNILLINKHTTIYEIKKRAKYFTILSKLSSREDDGTSDVLAQCQRIKPKDREDLKKEDFEEFELEESDAIGLLGVLKEGHKPDQKVSYKHFEKSMVKAHKNCVELGHTLVDAMGVVQVLDRVITLVLAVIAIIAWLLLTDIASTKLLILIASPLFGATFIFGDICKKIFEGIIFTFINHPFDVGDKCIIEKNELEVKRMSILATTFTVIGTKEEALYPNSALASIPIVNLKGEPDPNDQIELTLDPSYTTPMLDKLQAKILKFFEADKGERYNQNPTLEIKDIGKRSIRMVIQYQHVISNNETTHSQCLEKKRRQRSKLLIQLKQFTEEVSNGRKIGRTATIS